MIIHCIDGFEWNGTGYCQKRHDLSNGCSTLRPQLTPGDSHVLDCISCCGAVVDDDQAGYSVGHCKRVDVCGQAAAAGDPRWLDRCCMVKISWQSRQISHLGQID